MTEDDQLRLLMERAVARVEPSLTIWFDNAQLIRRRARRRPLQAVTAVAAAGVTVLAVTSVVGGGDTADTTTAAAPAAPATAPVPLEVTCREGWLTLDRYDAVAGADGVPVRVINDAPQSWGAVSMSYVPVPPNVPGGVIYSDGVIKVPPSGVVHLPLPPGKASIRCQFETKAIVQDPAAPDLIVTDPLGLWQGEDAEPSCRLVLNGPQTYGATAEDAATKMAAAINHQLARRGTGYPGSDQRRFVIASNDTRTENGVAAATRDTDGSWRAYGRTCSESPKD